MDFEDHYDFLNTLSDENKEKDIKCCENSENYQNDNDMIICRVCSNVITNISNNAEWRCYKSKDGKSGDPTRCGMPVNILLPESSVGSSISFSNKSSEMNQIRKMQNWNGMPYKERSLYKVFLTIQNTCEVNNIPSIIINEAKSIYSIVAATKISRGSNRDGIIAACVYFACKHCNVPRSSKEIAGMFKITVNVMTKGVKKCQEIIYMNKDNKKRLSTTNTIKPNHFIERFCNHLNIDEGKTNVILKLCDIIIKNNIISENTPPSIASGCIFYYIKQKNLDITKKDISVICKISEVTINKCCKLIEDKSDLFNEIFDRSEK